MGLGLLLLIIFGLCSRDVSSFRDQQYGLHGHGSARCVDIPQNLSLCHSIGYTRMRLPNLLEQETLDEVSQQSAFWLPLLASRCNSNTRLFLCSLFSPVCLDQPVYPCRSLCESVRDGCEPRMARFGFPWPGMFACDQFPIDNQLCIGQINLEESEEAVKVTKENLDDIAKEGGFSIDGAGRKKQPRPTQRKGKNKNRRTDANSAKENDNTNKRNETREVLKKEEVVKTLELICKSDFAARIKPTGIYSMDGSRESRITSKNVVFYRADDAVLRTAKSHPSDFGLGSHRQRYYFYVDDTLLAKLSKRNGRPSFKDDSTETPGNATSEGSGGGDDPLPAYKIHKNDQLLVAGNKTSVVGGGKQQGNRLTLGLIVRVDEEEDESPFVRRIIKTFKESGDFCSEARALEDPVHGDRAFKKFTSGGAGGRKRNRDKGQDDENNNNKKKKKKLKKKDKNNPDGKGNKKKDKFGQDGRRNKDKTSSEGGNGKSLPDSTTKKTRRAQGARNPMRGLLRSSDEE